jgi:hypothetical protein
MEGMYSNLASLQGAFFATKPSERSEHGKGVLCDETTRAMIASVAQ